MFQGANTNKLDLAVELDTERGRELLLELVEHSDVLIDNFSPRVLEQLGLDQDVLLARNPQLVVVRAPAYGVTGPWRGAAGLRADHRGPGGYRVGQRVPRPRARTAVGGRRRHGRRARDRRPPARARVPRPHRPRHVPRVPDGGLVAQPRRRAGGRVLRVRSAARAAGEPQRDRVSRRACTAPPTSTPTARATAGSRSRSPTTSSGRHCVRASIARRVVDRSRARDRRRVAGPRGRARRDHRRVVRDAVARPRSSTPCPARACPRSRWFRRTSTTGRSRWCGVGLFEPVEHPVTGTADFIGAPFRHANGPQVHNRRHAPLLGEHNRDVLTRILGLSDAEVDALDADGVIGDVVVGGLLH